MRGEDIAWAAGFFDGEGTTSVMKSRGRRYLRLQLAQCEREPLDRFASALGGRVTGPYANGPWSTRPIFKWNLVGAAAEAALAVLEPLLSGPKKRQAAAARAAQSA